MKEKTTGAKRRKQDASFKEEVLSMVAAGRPASEVAQRLGIGENLIYKWKSRNSKDQQPFLRGVLQPVRQKISRHYLNAYGSWSKSETF